MLNWFQDNILIYQYKILAGQVDAVGVGKVSRFWLGVKICSLYCVFPFVIALIGFCWSLFSGDTLPFTFSGIFVGCIGYVFGICHDPSVYEEATIQSYERRIRAMNLTYSTVEELVYKFRKKEKEKNKYFVSLVTTTSFIITLVGCLISAFSEAFF